MSSQPLSLRRPRIRPSGAGALLALCLLLTTTLSSPAAAQDTLEEADREFPTTITVTTGSGDVELIATGQATRKKFFFKIYAAVGYVDASTDLGSDPGAAIVAATGPKQIHLKMLRDVDSEKITNGINEALEKTATRPLEEIAAERERFLAVFGDEKLLEDADLRFTYLPGEGLEIRHDDEVKDVIPGEAFSRAFFEIYFGPEPVDDGMKEDLLRHVDDED